MIIGFAGPAGSGKTTAARVIGDAVGWGSCGTFSFAKPLKDCLQQLFKFSHDQLYTLEGKEAIDPRYGVSPRTVMQKFGTEFVRTTVPGLWEILMRERLTKRLTVYSVKVVDDIRFPTEAQLIRDLGGTVVHIRERCLVEHDHASEKGVPVSEYDLTITNNGSLEEFKQTVLGLAEYLGITLPEHTEP